MANAIALHVASLLQFPLTSSRVFLPVSTSFQRRTTSMLSSRMSASSVEKWDAKVLALTGVKRFAYCRVGQANLDFVRDGAKKLVRIWVPGRSHGT